MPYDHAANAAEAARLLEELKAKANPERLASIGVVSGDDAATAAMTLDKATGVHVYQADGGGWLVDLVFRDMPEGTSDQMGTPENNPYFDRESALKAAVGMIEFVMAVDRDRKRYPNGQVTFDFHGSAISFPKEQIDALRAAFPEPPDESEVVDLLEAMTERLYAEVGSLQATHASEAFKEELEGVVGMAFLADIDKWPRDEPAPSSPRH